MKKILQLRSSFDLGGTEMLLLHLFNYPQDRFQIHLVLLKDGSLIDRLKEQGGNVYYRWFRRRFLDLAVLCKMYRLVKREDINLAHTHQFIELCYAVCLKILIPKLRIIHQIHLIFAPKNLIFYLEKFLSQAFSSIVTVSHAAKAELVQSFGFKENEVFVLYNAVQTQGGIPPDRGTVNEKFTVPLDHNRVNIVMIANFVWGKDHETLFKAYDFFIRTQMPEVAFFFIGRKSNISEQLVTTYLTVEDLEKKRVNLCGPIPDAKDLLKTFDLVVMSSSSETFNLALVEAVISGKPILASDIPVFRELSEEGKYFHHFKTGDPEDFFRKLKLLMAARDQPSNSQHIQYFKEKFSYSSFLEGLAEIYGE